MALTVTEPEAGDNKKQATKRIRWATQKVSRSKSAARKRQSIMNRFHQKKGAQNEKKRESGMTDSTNDSPLKDNQGGDEEGTVDEEDESGERTIYFNQPLPAEARDEEGHPIETYCRNKIRTAKYTPLSFVPKNLWFQFHNIANIYFLLLIILGVS